MNIHNHGQIHRPHIQNQSLPANSGSKSANASMGEASVQVPDTTSMENLLDIVSNVGEVREQLVQNIKARVQAGEYLTQAAAVDTADAILNL